MPPLPRWLRGVAKRAKFDGDELRSMVAPPKQAWAPCGHAARLAAAAVDMGCCTWERATQHLQEAAVAPGAPLLSNNALRGKGAWRGAALGQAAQRLLPAPGVAKHCLGNAAGALHV